ncbi:TerD family protein [Pullulanibacillus sp. KACC 23026]|uniref:TerD family protein n=1 Tax=Pullulanibacillus sp. KACC 23026 TaxID=3028315 RepID=UPI0023B1AB00|nr:TerD family protein [Pullulanibacillus sp. KACC 23026]WEG12969.1 TerD family protein [Pullulanibacillus sp. KACC 23026]
MAISLVKGQKIDLTKGNAGLTSLLVGLGWDPVKRGFFQRTPNIDCDASVLMLNQQGRLERQEDVVYFGHLASSCGSVRHTGDNITGEGDGDDEQIIVTLNQVPDRIHRLLFVVNIYQCVERKQDFGMIQNAFIRMVDQSKRQELAHFNLSEDYAGRTALIPGEIYRHNGEWKFNALGQATNDRSLSEIAQRYT